MAEFPDDATVDTAAPAEPMQLAQIEEKKPAEFKGFFEHKNRLKSGHTYNIIECAQAFTKVSLRKSSDSTPSYCR